METLCKSTATKFFQDAKLMASRVQHKTPNIKPKI